MFKRKIRAKTCFLMGVVSGVLYLLASLLTMLGQGAASFLHITAFAFGGAMLLFLATTEGGEAGKGRRYKLLGLFLLWVISLPNLPPVSTLAGALVVPLLLLMYLEKGRVPAAAGMLALGLVYAGMDLYIQTTVYARYAEISAAPVVIPVEEYLPRYIVMAVLGVARALAAYLLFRQERDRPAGPGGEPRRGG